MHLLWGLIFSSFFPSWKFIPSKKKEGAPFACLFNNSEIYLLMDISCLKPVFKLERELEMSTLEKKKKIIVVL